MSTSDFNEVQWRHFWNHQNWTPVHLYDRTQPEMDWGNKKTLCGKKFNPDDAQIRGRDGDKDSLFRGCKSCARIAAKAKVSS